MNTSLSLALIVKNEEEVLAKCLDSIKDVVDEIIKYGQGDYDNRSGVWEMGYGTPHTINEVYSLITKQLGYKGEFIREKEREGDVRITKAKDIIEDRYGFYDGIKKTINWWKKCEK